MDDKKVTRFMLTFAVPDRDATLEDERVAFIERLRACPVWPKDIDSWSRDKRDWGWVSASKELSDMDSIKAKLTLDYLLTLNGFQDRILPWGEVAYDFPMDASTPNTIVLSDSKAEPVIGEKKDAKESDAK